MKDKIAKKILKMKKDKLMSKSKFDRDWELITALDLAIKALEERPHGSEWIPVSERLPDNNDEYLVNDADGNFGVGYYREDAKAWDSCNWGWLERSNNTDDTCSPGMGKVIAWMPLPESYKEAENDT